MPRRQILITALLAVLVLPVGCASVMHGTNQQVRIQSNPADARILINGHYYGQTPRTLNLRRKELHVVRLEKDGYLPYEIALERTWSLWTAGNDLIHDMVFGGTVGVALDAVGGGLYRLYPEHVVATLSPEAAPVAVPADVAADTLMNPLPTKQQVQALLYLQDLYEAGVMDHAEYRRRRAAIMDVR